MENGDFVHSSLGGFPPLKGLSSLSSNSYNASTQNLLKSICGLSYWGDVRMGFAEDPHKVSRIVAGSQRGLEGMYWPLMTTEAIGKDDLGAMSTLVTQVGPYLHLIPICMIAFSNCDFSPN